MTSPDRRPLIVMKSCLPRFGTGNCCADSSGAKTMSTRNNARVLTPNEKEISHGRMSWQTHWTYFGMGLLAESSLIGVWFGVAKLSRASCYKSTLMKKPIYAALDLHSRHSVLGSMDH